MLMKFFGRQMLRKHVKNLSFHNNIFQNFYMFSSTANYSKLTGFESLLLKDHDFFVETNFFKITFLIPSKRKVLWKNIFFRFELFLQL